MQWLVAFDLTPHSEGVVRLARWLHQRSGGAHLVTGVHVDARASLGLHGDFGDLGAGPDLERTKQQARAFLERHGVAEAFAGVEVQLGAPVARLRALVRERDVQGLLLGRAALAESRPLVALGAVPRRMLRRPELPTAIVPPDLDEARLGGGPLLVGVDPSAACLPAVALARRLAEALSLRVLLVHAMPRQTPVAVMGALSVQPRDPTMARSDLVLPQDTDAQEATIVRWIAAQGLQDLPLELRRGPVTATLRDAAREHDATMIIAGTRGLSLAERLRSTSVGTDVAARADRTVMVVPSPTGVT